ncbi:MAG TPA: ferric reductase-like transmembrane domain-containing protein, partial [Chloroflexota bacterium]|nr:ferric reductase-like transmembrane domain-containing protein [Chloroflexota bacterium]
SFGGTVPLLAAGASTTSSGASDASFFWYLSRTSGLVGYALLFLSVCLGLAIKTRFLDPLVPRWQNFDLHQFTALLATAFIGLHIFSLLGDHYIGFTLESLLVPLQASYKPEWVSVGIVAFYLFLIVTFSFYIRSSIGQKTWRALHYLTFAVFFMGLLHGLFAGSDTEAWAKFLYWGTAVAVTGVTGLRIWDSGSQGPAAVRPPGRRGAPSS